MPSDPVNYKATLNLPRTEFPMKANLPVREPHLLARWAEMKLYEKIQDKRKDAPLFVLHDGPPFANGDVHIGTALNKILKDIIIKYRTMRGFRVPFVPGWDCHGQPIEFKVKKELGKEGVNFGQEEIRRRCRAYAEKYIEIQRRQFQRLGVFGDWEQPYITMSHQYEAEVIGAIADMVEDGYVYRGKKPVYWCATCRTALAEAEVEYADHISPSVYVKFPVKGRQSEYAVIWTTTPWTLPANLAIAVKHDFSYVRAKTKDDEIWIIAEALVEQVTQACGTSLTIEEKLTGLDLENLVARHPFRDQNSPVIFSPYVTLDQGTGLVHTAPGHGAEDYEIGQKYGLSTFAPVDDSGYFTDEAGQFQGQFVFKANGTIVEHLKSIGALAGSADVQHSYPHCWRCKQPIIFRAMEQWFIALDHCGLRQTALDEIPNVFWIPKWGENRISGTIEQRPDWCISRQRAWGVPLPFLECKKCDSPILNRDLILQFRDQVVEHGVDIWFEQSVAEIFGEIKCPSCESTNIAKCPDIVDVWFESGVSHRSVLHGRPELIFPADLYLEGSDQHRGWFQSSLLTALATEQKVPFKSVLTHGFLVVHVEDSGRKQKVSKSAGKPANAEDYVNRFGADVLRLWLLSEDYQNDIPLSEEIFARIGETYFKVRNTLRILLGNLYDFDPLKDMVKPNEMEEIDQWILSRLQELVADVTQAYETYEFHKVYHLINTFCSVDVSSFYIDVLKDMLYTLAPNSEERRSAQTAICKVVDTLARLLAPAMPFTAEEVWGHLPNAETDSVHLADFPSLDDEIRDKDLQSRWERLFELRRIASIELEKARQEKLIGKSLEARIEIVPDKTNTRDDLRKLGDTLETILIVSQVNISQVASNGELKVVVKTAEGQKCVRCWRWRKDVGENHDHPELCGRCATVVSN